MNYFSRKSAERKARKEKRAAEQALLHRLLRESYAHPITGLDPGATALLYTSVASSHVSHDEDVSDNADDTALDDTAVDSFESESDRYHPVEPDSGYNAYADDPYTPDESPSSPYNSFDSGPSYTSSYDSGGSSYSSDSGSSFSSGE